MTNRPLPWLSDGSRIGALAWRFKRFTGFKVLSVWKELFATLRPSREAVVGSPDSGDEEITFGVHMLLGMERKSSRTLVAEPKEGGCSAGRLKAEGGSPPVD